MARAKEANAYLMVPEILHWEVRATEWSGVPSKAEIKISVFDAASGAVVKNSIVSGQSASMTFSGNRPEDLMREAIPKWVSRAFGN